MFVKHVDFPESILRWFSNRVNHDSLFSSQYSPSVAPNAAPPTAHLGLHLAREHAFAQHLPVADIADGRLECSTNATWIEQG